MQVNLNYDSSSFFHVHIVLINRFEGLIIYSYFFTDYMDPTIRIEFNHGGEFKSKDGIYYYHGGKT